MGWVANVTPRPFYSRERAGTHCVGGWVASEPVWTDAENLTSTGIRSPDRPTRSESLYRLGYPSPPRTEIGKELNSSPVFDEIWSNSEICLRRNASERLTKDNKSIQTKEHQEPVKTTEESSGCARPERGNRWHNCTVA